MKAPPFSRGISHSITTLRLFPFAPYNRPYPSVLVRLGGRPVSLVHLSPFVERVTRRGQGVARMRLLASLPRRARERWSGGCGGKLPAVIAVRGSVACQLSDRTDFIDTVCFCSLLPKGSARLKYPIENRARGERRSVSCSTFLGRRVRRLPRLYRLAPSRISVV